MWLPPACCCRERCRTSGKVAFSARLLSTLLTAVAMAGGFAHLLALPNRPALSRDEYFTAQQVYRGWALLGVPLFGALVSTAVQAALERGTRRWLTTGAALG